MADVVEMKQQIGQIQKELAERKDMVADISDMKQNFAELKLIVEAINKDIEERKKIATQKREFDRRERTTILVAVIGAAGAVVAAAIKVIIGGPI